MHPLNYQFSAKVWRLWRPPTASGYQLRPETLLFEKINVSFYYLVLKMIEL